MARKVRYLDENVLDAALARIRHIYATHDTVAVCFSGGKDSLVVLHLARQVALELGATPLQVVFRDEELIPDAVIDFVAYHRDHMNDVELHWFAVPLASQKFVLGTETPYVQFDPAREWVRQPPAYAIRPRGGEEHLVLDQFTADGYIVDRLGLKGKVALLNGIRAAEGVARYRASVNKLNESYINASSSPRVSLCKPIYDWQERDVYRLFYERGIPYCPYYDQQLYAGEGLRISTPLHSMAAHNLRRLREVDPEFYDRVLKVFPEVAAQDRYWHSLDKDHLKRRYGTTYEGVARYIDDHIASAAQRKKARDALRRIMLRVRHSPEAYPPESVFTHIHRGYFKRELMPLPKVAQERARRKAAA